MRIYVVVLIPKHFLEIWTAIFTVRRFTLQEFTIKYNIYLVPTVDVGGDSEQDTHLNVGGGW
jgi:hypothetical protein